MMVSMKIMAMMIWNKKVVVVYGKGLWSVVCYYYFSAIPVYVIFPSFRISELEA